MVKLGYKISGVQERDFLIAQELKMLKMIEQRESVVQYNGKTRDILSCFIKAVDSFENTDITHACILQDDLELCENFVEITTDICSQFPQAVWALFNSRIKESDYDKPYVKIRGCGFYAPAIIFPMSRWSEFKSWKKENCDDCFHDDVAIGEWCKRNKVEVMTTVPSLVDHLGGKVSLLGHNSGLKSKVWKGAEAPKKVNWKTDEFCMSKFTMPTGWKSYLEGWL
jgi:hypothetical protein